MTDLLWPTIFTVAVLAVGGASLYAITHWLPEPREPTEYDLAFEQLRQSLVETQAAIMRPLLPILQKLAVEMAAIFPPLSRRERALLWVDAHTPSWLNPWTREYWLVMGGMWGAILIFGGIVVWLQP